MATVRTVKKRLMALCRTIMKAHMDAPACFNPDLTAAVGLLHSCPVSTVNVCFTGMHNNTHHFITIAQFKRYAFTI